MSDIGLVDKIQTFPGIFMLGVDPSTQLEIDQERDGPVLRINVSSHDLDGDLMDETCMSLPEQQIRVLRDVLTAWLQRNDPPCDHRCTT